MRIAFDIDGVLVDTVKNIVRRAGRKFNVDSSREEPDTYDGIHRCISRSYAGETSSFRPSDETVKAYITDEWKKPDVYLTADPIEGYKDLSMLGSTLIGYISHRPEGLTYPTTQYLRAWGFWNVVQTTVMCLGGSGKSKLDMLQEEKITHYVDDDSDTAIKLWQNGINVILIRKPYNTHVKAISYGAGPYLYVVESLSDAIKLLATVGWCLPKKDFPRYKFVDSLSEVMKLLAE